MLAGPRGTAPSPSDVGTAALRRVLLPVVALGAAVIGVGYLIGNVLALDESAISQAVVDARTPTMNTISAFASGLADTKTILVTALVVCALVWWRSGRWWFATVPLVALAAEVAVHLASTAVVNRTRPEVEQLDDAPPTSSFPSGHTGASSAVYLSFALMATRISHRGARLTVVILCALVPVAVALSRVYRGMHHPTDVLAGLVVGGTCAWIGWTWLREDRPA
ncbi:phosphatase PAP2 family protein [Demequina sp. NBRC 110054]|uniref:phosphatase PAP2 family protein n=1 Tax=Demequina sp. NBRC 110054 TaxID=1570343 RepID=UPI000A06A278|nr:phosphatase PAP2 family protein [Demequina sp. NBRC 110054]